jgi:hypothetical protein
MAAALFGTAGLEWGLDAETGILAQSYDRTVSGKEKIAPNHEGEAAGVSIYDPVAEHSIEGYVTGSTGIAAAAFGTALTIANIIEGNGVSAGIVICTGVTNRLQNEDYHMLTANAKQWPLITTP